MISRRIDADSVAATAQDADDILSLRRVISPGDVVYGRATWVIKRVREYARPDRGERIRISLGVSVDRISLDNTLDVIRIGGIIMASDNEAVPHGGRHSLKVGVGDSITIRKEKWTKIHRALLKNCTQAGFILVAIDQSECGLARLYGTHVETYPSMRSGWGGKRYAVNFDMKSYIEQVAGTVLKLKTKGDTIVLFGPGTTKNRLTNQLSGHDVRTIEGVDSGGDDGIRLFARSDTLKQAVSESRLAGAASVLDDIMVMAARGSRRFSMGYADTITALKAGAVDQMVYSDGIFAGNSEDAVIEMLNTAEASRVTTYAVDSSTDTGLRITKMGGVAAKLRYSLS